MSILGQGINIYIETDNGMVYEMPSSMVRKVQITHSCDMINSQELGEKDVYLISGAAVTEFEISGIASGAEVGEFVNLRHKLSGQWRCTWCGQINPKEARCCGGADKHAVGCGGPKSFIYGGE